MVDRRFPIPRDGKVNKVTLFAGSTDGPQYQDNDRAIKVSKILKPSPTFEVKSNMILFQMVPYVGVGPTCCGLGTTLPTTSCTAKIVLLFLYVVQKSIPAALAIDIWPETRRSVNLSSSA